MFSMLDSCFTRLEYVSHTSIHKPRSPDLYRLLKGYYTTVPDDQMTQAWRGRILYILQRGISIIHPPQELLSWIRAVHDKLKSLLSAVPKTLELFPTPFP
eukprot:gene6062-4361_t